MLSLLSLFYYNNNIIIIIIIFIIIIIITYFILLCHVIIIVILVAVRQLQMNPPKRSLNMTMPLTQIIRITLRSCSIRQL